MHPLTYHEFGVAGTELALITIGGFPLTARTQGAPSASQFRSSLFFSSPVGFRVPASPAPPHPLRTRAAGFLCGRARAGQRDSVSRRLSSGREYHCRGAACTGGRPV